MARNLPKNPPGTGPPAGAPLPLLSPIAMNAYTALLGLVALFLLHAAWRERTLGNHRDAKALAACSAGLGALAATFGFVL